MTQGVATSIANGLANGYITPAYATNLQADLKTLANALGLGAAATPSSSTTTRRPRRWRLPMATAMVWEMASVARRRHEGSLGVAPTT